MTILQLAMLTRIKPFYIEAIEAGQLGTIPDPVYARGFVRVLAESLEVEHTEEFMRFARGSADWDVARNPRPPFLQANVLPFVSSAAIVLTRSFLMVLVPLGLLVVALMQNQFVQSYQGDPMDRDSLNPPEESSPVYISDEDLARRLAEMPKETLVPDNRLKILARGHVDVLVRTQSFVEERSQVLFERRMNPGEVFEEDLHYRSVEISSSSPESILVLFNGEALPFPTDDEGKTLGKLLVPEGLSPQIEAPTEN